MLMSVLDGDSPGLFRPTENLGTATESCTLAPFSKPRATPNRRIQQESLLLLSSSFSTNSTDKQAPWEVWGQWDSWSLPYTISVLGPKAAAAFRWDPIPAKPAGSPGQEQGQKTTQVRVTAEAKNSCCHKAPQEQPPDQVDLLGKHPSSTAWPCLCYLFF